MGGIRGETSEKTAVFLSVVMPVYNGEKDLPAAIESILNATYKDIELLLVDDGSTDQSAGICVQYQKTDKRIRYIYQENSGIVSARNRGLLEASGAYLCFCDQDDIVAPRMYERLIGRMQTCGAQIGICGTGRLINGKKARMNALETAYMGRKKSAGSCSIPSCSADMSTILYKAAIIYMVHYGNAFLIEALSWKTDFVLNALLTMRMTGSL